MAFFETKFNSRRFDRAMKRAPRRLAAEMSRGMQQHALTFDAHMKRTRFGGQSGSLQTRTGKLARSMGFAGPRKGASIGALRILFFVGQGIAGRYARIQEFGGTVTPTNSKYLTIPLPDNLTAAGVARFKSARELMTSRRGQTFIAKSKRGNLLIGLRGGSKGERTKWLWVLKRKVKLKPRLGYIDAFNSRAMRTDRVNRMNAAVRRALKPAKGTA